jgi:peptidoglycan hydrolase-like protein with peptidoglycan-binding domain
MANLAAPIVPPSSALGDKTGQPQAAKSEEPAGSRSQAQPTAPATLVPPPSEPKTASLAAPLVAPPSPPFNPESVESLKAAQQELRRLGCYAGGIDGQTGPQTRRAFAAAAEKLGPGSGVQPLTEHGLQVLRDHKDVLCPPAVAVKAAPVQPTAPPAPSYAAPPVAPPAPAPASPPPPAVVSNPPPAAAPAPAAQEKKKIHISM